ncbi:hypothetical protein PHYC_03680 [Phycisphaerales bacterium]|nr:hypothetical protein PHYC_03680 [Phycisphaerales bacterium]
MAIVAAAITLPILIALYLLKLRRRPVRVSTILFWPPAAKDVQANVPWRMLRPSWLLFLHLALLTLLLTAAGRPAILGVAGQGDRVILLLDCSASMSARDVAGGPTRLDAAKARARELINAGRSGSGRRVAIVAFAAEPSLLCDFTSSRTLLRDSLDRVAGTDQPGELRPAMELAAALGGGDEERTPSAVLISDGGVAYDATAQSPIHLRYERVGPGSGTDSDNLGIVALAAQRDARDPGMVRVFLDVVNASREEKASPLAVSLDGQMVARRAVEVPAGAESVGHRTVSIELASPSGGVLMASLSRVDALDCDNAAALVLPPPTRPAAWLVRPEGSGEPKDHAGSWLLSDAMEELGLRRLERLTPEVYEQSASRGEMEFVDLVVFDRVTPSVLPRCPSLHFGAVPSIEGIEASEEEPAAAGVVLWKRSHPVLRYVSLDSLVVAKSIPMRLTPGPGLEELAQGPRGSLVGLSEHGGVRRLIVAFDLSQSNWPLQAGFPVFLASAVDYLTMRGEASVGESYRTAAPAVVRATGAGEIVLRGPTEVRVNAIGPGEVRTGAITRAGVYLVSGPASIRALAVNLADERESGLQSPADVPVATRAGAAGASVREPREIWTWFVGAAALLLLAEWMVYARSARA